MSRADIGVAGLAVMGENLAVNMMSKGFTVAVYNRTVEKVDAFAKQRCEKLPVVPAHSVKEFVESLSVPRKIFMMVKAGTAVDAKKRPFCRI
jgi:6-phosphogluconate dehydrogenase